MLTFLPGLLRLERVPGAFVSDASPVSRALLVLCVNQGISASFSLLRSYRRLRTTRFRSIKGPQHLRSKCRRHKRCRFDPWVRKIPWRKKWEPTPVFLPGKPHGQRSLVGYSPWDHKESGTTEGLTHIHTTKRLQMYIQE